MPEGKSGKRVSMRGMGAGGFFIKPPVEADLTGQTLGSSAGTMEKRSESVPAELSSAQPSEETTPPGASQLSTSIPAEKSDVQPGSQSNYQTLYRLSGETSEQPNYEDVNRKKIKATVEIYIDQDDMLGEIVQQRLRDFRRRGIRVDRRKYDKSVVLRELLDIGLAYLHDAQPPEK